MRCPHCRVGLLVSERKGIEIDYCPECRGVWLDRGELDKIVERSQVAPSGGAVAVAPAPPVEARPRERDERRYDDRDDDRGPRNPPEKKKRTSFLEDIFDF